jgi:methyl-accepting chemotaxis protein
MDNTAGVVFLCALNFVLGILAAVSVFMLHCGLLSVVPAFVLAVLFLCAAVFAAKRFCCGIRVLLDRMSARVMAMGSGDFSSGNRTVPVNGEIELALSGLDALAARMSSVFLRLRDSSASLYEAANAVSRSAGDISESAQQQTQSFEKLSQSMQSMVMVASLATDTTGKVSSGIAELGGNMSAAQDAIGKIAESSNRISQSTEIITDLADQTNLLALNAAIEAARAGEHGKGFAVVADEVRKLAERSAIAAKEINSLISVSLAEVKNGVQLTRVTGDSLAGITVEMKSVSDKINSISETAYAGVAAMQECADITARNNASSGELLASSRQLAVHAENSAGILNDFGMPD